MKKRAEITYQEEIGHVVERLRTEKGWTQTQLAEAIGSSQSAVHRIEKGGQNISLELIRKLSQAAMPILINVPFLSVKSGMAL